MGVAPYTAWCGVLVQILLHDMTRQGLAYAPVRSALCLTSCV